ncbi:DNA transfer protein [Cronobacter sakazakii]|uniref:DNA transfer protein n=1 Tax=Cronobacter sakazakii TaxID=28141 RepID=UPI000BE9E481|nr:DNA transfer protein [Cronobacter sakazakii]ELY4817765.1 DNA transfer protein [Cronobacter malonaticus]EIX1501602.1 DNA transfer protein [Cronobacter sakazakii]EIX6183454.1 DNA transfer protein [Cronobacter sakazakii]EIX6196120.1 DNA transfer protein [Cronobacter sakazakii]EIX6203801.1 DNA transfer protein [Cronobacter sakazakii]
MLIFQLASKHLENRLYLKGGKGGDGGASAQAKAINKQTDLQREQWQTVMNNLAPFTPLAQQYVSQLQNLSSLQGQNSALNSYYGSDQYKQLANQARYQTLQSAEATGGLGSTATSNQLATIAPTLGQSWLSGQMQNYNNLANIGLGALQGQANAGQTYANNMGALYQQQANLAAANANRPSGFQSALSGGLGGAATGAAIGSAFGGPGIGTAIGAGIGVLGSLF